MATSPPSPWHPLACALVVNEKAQVTGLHRSSLETEESLQAFRVVENDVLQLIPMEADVAFRRWLEAPTDRFILRLYGTSRNSPVVVSCVPLIPVSSWTDQPRCFLMEFLLEPKTQARQLPEERWKEAKLTSAEIRVAELLIENLTSDQIASQLNITLNTVRTHVKRIYAKVHVNTRSAFVRASLGEPLAPAVVPAPAQEQAPETFRVQGEGSH